MTSVHGITVAGGTFPASIWRLFMSRALRRRPELSWPYPRNPAVWVPFTGQYAFVGAPPKPEKPEKDKDKDKNGTTTEPPTAPPTTTEPPPTTTGR